MCVCVRVCVYVCEREGACVCVCYVCYVCVRERGRVYACITCVREREGRVCVRERLTRFHTYMT